MQGWAKPKACTAVPFHTSLNPPIAKMDDAPAGLQETLAAIRENLKVEHAQHTAVLKNLHFRLQSTLDALDEGDLGHVRPRADVLRKLAQVTQAQDALNEASFQARAEATIRTYILRLKELEQQEREKKKASEEKAKTSENRFLPTPPAATTAMQQSSKKNKNYSALVSQELKYKFGLEQKPVDLILFDMCPTCMVAMQYNVALQQLICPMPGCGFWKRFADMTSAALAFGEEIEFCKYSYNPVNHLDDTIKYAEAGEAYVVPPAHLEKVMKVLYKMAIRPEDITIKIIRSIIYDIKGIKTENTVQIYSRLTGRSPWRLSNFAKDQVRIMFITEEPYYRKHCGVRTNNLSYPYKLYKYCELLGYWEMLESLPLLRGPCNLSLHDAIQTKINRDLDWEFIPTVKQDDNMRISQTLKKAGII